MNTTNKMQLNRSIYYSKSALHVSDDVFAHHQEHLTVFTASGNVHQCEIMDDLELIPKSSMTLETVNTVRYSWWWAKTSPETCRATRSNKLTWWVASCLLYSYLNHDARIRECQVSLFNYRHYKGARSGAVGWGTALQAGRSRVRFPMVSLDSFIDIILPAALWPWGRLSL